MSIGIVLAMAYFVGGIIALGIFDLITKRIRRKLIPASYDAQTQLVNSGTVASQKTALVLLIFAMWIFWPLVIANAWRIDNG